MGAGTITVSETLALNLDLPAFKSAPSIFYAHALIRTLLALGCVSTKYLYSPAGIGRFQGKGMYGRTRERALVGRGHKGRCLTG